MSTLIYLFPAHLDPHPLFHRRLTRQFPEMTSLADDEWHPSLSDWIEASAAAPRPAPPIPPPILFTLHVLAFLDRLLADGRLPQALAGQGVGEISALFAAGVFDFPTGLRLVRQLAAPPSTTSAHHSAFVSGPDLDTFRELLVHAGLTSLHLAPTPDAKQFILSGIAQDLEAALPIFQSAGAQTNPPTLSPIPRTSLPSGLDTQAFAAALDSIPLSPPRIPVLSTATAQPHHPAQLKPNLLLALTQPPRWNDCLVWLHQWPDPQFTELGPAPA